MNEGSSNGMTAIRRRLDDPDTGEKVGRLLDRLDQIETLLDRVEMVTATIPAAVATAADTFDGIASRGQEKGIDIDERVSGALQLAEKLTEPRTIIVLSQLVERVDQLQELLELADQAPGFVAMAVDTVDHVVQRANEAGIDVDARLRSTYGLGEKLTSPETVNALGAVLDPGAVTVVGMIGDTLAQCREDCLSAPEPPSAGVWDLLKLIRNEDGRRSLAFLINYLTLWGQGVKNMHSQHRAKLAANSEDGNE
jgi:hypothetical protein